MPKTTFSIIYNVWFHNGGDLWQEAMAMWGHLWNLDATWKELKYGKGKDHYYACHIVAIVVVST